MTNHVVNLDLAKRLKEAGYPQGSNFYWIDGGNGPFVYNHDFMVDFGGIVRKPICVAPLATELLERLPEEDDNAHTLTISRTLGIKKWRWSVYYCRGTNWKNVKSDDSLPDALAEMWLWLKESKYL